MTIFTTSSTSQKKTWRTRLESMIANRLTHPHLAIHLAFVAMIFTLPALWVGFQFDDYAQRMTMLGAGQLAHRTPLGFLDVYSFLNGNSQITDFFRNTGGIP